VLLVLVYSTDEGLASSVLRDLRHVEIAPGVAVTWEPEEKVGRILGAAKRRLIERWEAEGSGPSLEYAVLKLTDEQYNSVRHMVRRALDERASALAGELRRLAADMRRGKGRVHELKARFRRLASAVAELNEASARLDIHTSALAELNEAYREANAEYLKLK
jgi:chromosome segregation ATPase